MSKVSIGKLTGDLDVFKDVERGHPEKIAKEPCNTNIVMTNYWRRYGA
ncbi:MAG TPA: hypothetical protein VK589_08340 [Chryseolinea sp.]|nr:hypothetical protein [Chryseolinea sp.]